VEEAVHKSRYVVTNQNGGWRIRNAHHHVTATFPSKAQALCAAIELAEKDGECGHAPEVLVRHEDDRFITAPGFKTSRSFGSASGEISEVFAGRQKVDGTYLPHHYMVIRWWPDDAAERQGVIC
jgi:hypothetical protein